MAAPVPRALVLSGDNDLSQHLKGHLQKSDYPEVDILDNGVEGLKKLAQRPYDVVVCHNKLKFISGWNFIKEMKTSDKIVNMPVLLMGGAPAPATDEEMNQYGLVKYLKSPPSSSDLGMVLNSTLQLFRTSGTIENKFTKAKAALLGAKTDQAIEIFSELHGLTKKNMRSSIGLAEAYTQGGQQDKAEAIILESLKTDGKNPTAALMQIKILIKKAKFPEAHAAALELLGPVTDSPFYHVRVLNQYAELKHLEEAEHVCRDAIGKDFKLPDFVLSMARLLFAKGRYDECITNLESAIAQFGATAEIMNIKGASLRKLNRLDEGLQAYEMALKLSPMDSRIYFNMAVCCISKKAIKEAQQHLEMCLKITPDFPNAQQKLDEVKKYLITAA